MGQATVASAAPARIARRGRRLATNPDALLLVPPLLFLGVFFLYPLAHTVSSSFGGGGAFGHYSAALSDPLFVKALLRTLLVGLISTVVCLLLGYPIAYEVTRPRTRMRTLLLGVIIVTFWISVLIRAYSWVAILEPDGIFNDVLSALSLTDHAVTLQGSVTAVTIGMTHFLLPYMVLVLIPTLRAVDPKMVAAARSLGANRSRTFARVTLPLTLGGIVGGCILTFILSIGFFIMPAILGGPGLPFVANIIGDQVGQFQNFDQANAMAVLLTLVVVACYLVLQRVVDPMRILGRTEK